MRKIEYNKIIDFIKNQKTTDIDILNYIYGSELEELKEKELDEVSEFINELLIEEDATNIEIIGNYDAMKYLQENDYSLNTSIELAKDLGYELENINSKLLASLLASKEKIEELGEFIQELESFCEELEG